MLLTLYLMSTVPFLLSFIVVSSLPLGSCCRLTPPPPLRPSQQAATICIYTCSPYRRQKESIQNQCYSTSNGAFKHNKKET
jgi:hypothetical protein